jgi:hypothetical protein
LQGFADVGLKSASIIARCGKTWESTYPSHEPEGCSVYTGTHARIASFQSDQGRDRDPQALSPRALGFTAANTGNGQIFAQSP